MHKCDGAKLPCFRVNIRFHGIFPWLKVVVQLYSMVKGAKYKKTVWNNNNDFSFLSLNDGFSYLGSSHY